MPDIGFRFHKDMIVLSAPIEQTLARQGIDVEADRGILSMMEPETIRDILSLELVAGAKCLVTSTANITKARLTHLGLEDNSRELAQAALSIANELNPQHVLAEIGPTLLPIDPTSRTSLKQGRSQYGRAARDFLESGGEIAGQARNDRGEGRNGSFDAFFLNDMVSPTDLMCALTGVCGICGKPVFASIQVEGTGKMIGRPQTLEEAIEVMAEYGAAVVGFETKAPLEEVLALVERAKHICDLPILVQIEVQENDRKQRAATPENPYFCPDTMVEAAAALHAAGVQFLRATGNASPSYTGLLAATTDGFDVVGTTM